MNVYLKERTKETVAIYFEKTNTPEIRKVLPQKAQTLEEAVEDYRKTLLPGSTSYGRTIWVEDKYVGDIWCYCIDLNDEPNAMISYCIFDKNHQNQGAATAALKLFINEIVPKFHLKSLGAFTYSSHTASIRVLEKNNFRLMEEFEEDGILSKYFQLNLPEVSHFNLLLYGGTHDL